MDIIDIRNLISSTLEPLIGSKYVLLEIPHYFNIGDILIWEGELRFLSQLKSKMLYSTSSHNYDASRKIPTDATILLQGGGNWGDIWKDPHNFRKKIISLYPNNKILVFPQTIHYNKKENLINDINFFKQYPNVTICARDKNSYQILQTYFKNNPSYLLPDMAFFVDINNINNQEGNKILFAKRIDKEYDERSDYNTLIPADAEIHDWPTYENYHASFTTLGRVSRILQIIDKCFNSSLKMRFIDFYWRNIFKKKLINIGINFLNDYHTIYTTRLHIAILGLLMNKKVYMLDNSYGKLSGFFDAWLKDFTNVRLLK